jgi:hypothetical protein
MGFDLFQDITLIGQVIPRKCDRCSPTTAEAEGLGPPVAAVSVLPEPDDAACSTKLFFRRLATLREGALYHLTRIVERVQVCTGKRLDLICVWPSSHSFLL